MSWLNGLGFAYDEATQRKSSSLFIAKAAFWICAFRVITHDWGFKLARGKEIVLEVTFGKMDAALVGAFLLPCLSLYFGRRLFPGPPEPPPQIKDPAPPAEGAVG